MPLPLELTAVLMATKFTFGRCTGSANRFRVASFCALLYARTYFVAHRDRVLAACASIWPRDHFCCGTIAPALVEPDDVERILAISIPIGATVRN
jgi:hypothetical protein